MNAATIGVISIGHEPTFFTGRYFREILTVTSQAAVKNQHFVRLITLSHEQSRSAHTALPILQNQNVDALLLVAPSHNFLYAVEELLQKLPSIIISAPQLDIPYNYVCSDNYSIMRQMVTHLSSLGHRRIRLLQPSPFLSGDYWERARGYRDAIEALGYEVMLTGLEYPITDDNLKNLVLADKPDVLIAPSDVDALALLGRLQRRGLRVPNDIALVGFDNEDFTSETFPAFTTVNQPFQEMARCAITYLIEQLEDPTNVQYQKLLPNQLIIRESCGAKLKA